MNEFFAFAKRYYKVKQGVQDLAELALAKAVLAEAQAEAAVTERIEQYNQARQAQAQSFDALEWRAWEAHKQWLTRQMVSERELHQSKMDFSLRCRDEVLTAFVEQKKWETVVESRSQQMQLEQTAADNQLLDEQAGLRFGREQ